MRGGSPPLGKGSGDEPVRGGWGVWKGLAILLGFVVSLVAIFSVTGAPVPDLGIEDTLNTVALAVVALFAVGFVLAALWFVRALASPETNLL